MKTLIRTVELTPEEQADLVILGFHLRWLAYIDHGKSIVEVYA